ncbi:Tetraspanin family [Popillia japonica]|uniref:Tetraspanin n=1 Tax=Popillia japonica TaxID=7064 RepID=A0AAW1MAE4_POPJA
MGKHLQTVAAMACMKTLLMVFNFIFWASGIVILAIGIYMRVSLYQYMVLSPEFSGTASYVLIGTGAFIILIGSLACCCTVKGQPVLLYVYGAFLAVVFVLELGTGVSIYAFRDHFPQGLDQALNKSMSNYYFSNSTDAGIWDSMQKNLYCCGNHGYNDWLNLNPPMPVPNSCCKEDSCDVSDETQIFKEGCYDKLVQLMKSNIAIVAGAAIGITFFPLVGVLLSCCLASVINKAKYEQMA